MARTLLLLRIRIGAGKRQQGLEKPAQLVQLLCKQEGLSWIPRAHGKIPGMVAQEMGGSPRSADLLVNCFPLGDAVSKEVGGTPDDDTCAVPWPLQEHTHRQTDRHIQ